MALESSSAWRTASLCMNPRISRRTHAASPAVLASQSMEESRKVFKELGLYSLKKKIEDVVIHAETTAKTALELEEARRIQHEEMFREHNLWDNPSKSNERLTELAFAIKDVNALKDIRYKAEEAKLIVQLAEMDFVNDQLFRQAYSASIDVGKILERYEMSKLFHGPYDREGACMIITAEPEEHSSKVWAEKLLNMYSRWAEKQGCKGRITEIDASHGGGISSATIDFETEYFYGFLSGEQGAHLVVQNSHNESALHKACASVEVIPLFLESEANISIDACDLDASSQSGCGEQLSNEPYPVVRVSHLPTGASAQCSGERSRFANKIKAINRLKAKLLAIMWRQGVSNVNNIDRNEMASAISQEIRRYVLGSKKSVQDMRTGVQLSDLNSVLDGNIESYLRAHINLRRGRDIG